MSQYVLKKTCDQLKLEVRTDCLSNSTLLAVLPTIVILWPCHVLGSKHANSCPAIAETLPYCHKFHLPQWRTLSLSTYNRGFLSFPHVYFLHLFMLRKERWSFKRQCPILFDSWQSEPHHGGEECRTHVLALFCGQEEIHNRYQKGA